MTDLRAELRLPLRFTRTPLAAAFADAVRAGRIFGARCPVCATVFVPPRSFCPRCWERCDGSEIPVSDHGVVATYVVVNVPFQGQQVEIPYVLAHILLDGAGTAILHLLGPRAGRPTIGQRVRAVWRPPETRIGSFNDDIEHFEPIDQR